MLEQLAAAVGNVLDPPVLLVILAASLYGVCVGSIPGLTATMAVALLVPLTLFLSDIQAIAAIVAAVTCSIFAGDIPGCLLRIPGTPASAAYTEDAYQLTCRGLGRRALSICLWFSVIGGFFGTFVLAVAAPQLARFATKFTSYEYFWLYLVGLTCAAVVSEGSRLKGALALLLGLLLSAVGLGNDYSVPRLTFGFDELITGINFIPAMIGLFGMSEVLRNVLRMGSAGATGSASASVSGPSASTERASGASALAAPAAPPAGLDLTGGWWRELVECIWPMVRRRKLALLVSSSIGALIGILPGAGADIAAWISYAVSKRFSRHPEEYGRGSLEGLADAGGANNSALGGAWVPALVFGIPGDSVTAIAIGVLLMKNITPGPDVFDPAKGAGNTSLALTIFVTFFICNVVLIPIGMLAIQAGTLLIRIPRRILLPLIVMFCIVGSYAMNASYFDVWVMLAMGLLGFVLEAYKVPIGPVVLGLVLGGELEHKFIQCITKEASLAPFFRGPISITLAVVCLALWCAPAITAALRRRPTRTASSH